MEAANTTTKMNQDVLNAVTASTSVATKGFQEIASETTEFTKKSYEDSAAVAEKLVAAKRFDKAFEIQNEYAKSAYEAFVAQTTKLNELYTSLAKETFKPFESAVATPTKAKA